LWAAGEGGEREVSRRLSFLYSFGSFSPIIWMEFSSQFEDTFDSYLPKFLEILLWFDFMLVNFRVSLDFRCGERLVADFLHLFFFFIGLLALSESEELISKLLFI